MAEIIKVYRQSILALRFIGKKYGDDNRVNGMFFSENTPVPDNFAHIDFSASDLGVCWVYGKGGDVYSKCNLSFLNFSLVRYYVIIGHNCVLPKYRNQGIGKHQITFALNKLQKDGFRYTKVSTKRDQFFTHARKMYESCGFVECAPYRNDGENMIYYTIQLKNH